MECINSLKKQKPVQAVAWNQGLCELAKYHTEDTGPKGQTGHTSSNGMDLQKRKDLFGKGDYVGENISYGMHTAMEVLV